MFDVLTYVLAKKKAAAQLESQIAEISDAVDSATEKANLTQQLYQKTLEASQQAVASASAVSYAFGPDVDGNFSFFEKVETETTGTDNSN